MTNIDLRFDDVFKEVRRITEYIGSKSGEYDQVRSIDKDHDQMMFWYLDACALVNGILDRVLSRNISPDYITGDFSMVLSVDNHMGETIGKIATRLIATHMVNQWLKIVAPSLVQLYASDEQLISQELMQSAYYRQMPR